MLLAPQLRRIACVLIALGIVGAPITGAFPVSVPLTVLVITAGLLVAARVGVGLLASPWKSAA